MSKKIAAAMLVLSIIYTSGLRAQTTSNLWTAGTGDWTNEAHWSAGAAPIPSDLVFITNISGNYTVTIDSGTAASTLTNFNLTVGNNVVAGTTTQTLSLVTPPAPLVIQGSLTNRQRGVISGDNASIQVSTNFLQSGRLILTGSNSVLRVANSLASGGNMVIGGGGGAVASFSGGSVIITNANNTATLVVGNNSAGHGSLFVTNTLLRISSYNQGTGRAYIDNSGLASTSLLRTVTVAPLGDTAASLTLAGGVFDGTVGRVSLSSGFANDGRIPTVTNSGAIWNMNNGDVSIGNIAGMGAFFVQTGGTNRQIRGGADTGEYRLGAANNSTGTLILVSGLLYADGDGANGALSVGTHVGARGVFNQYGGRVVITNGPGLGNSASVKVGVSGKAYWTQTNGTLLADRFILGTNAQSFVVGKDALIEIKQAVGFSNAAPFSLSSLFEFDGTLKFSPATATLTQNLQLAGLDLGATLDGYSNNFSLGTLDLSNFGIANRLRLLSPFSVASTALYVDVISPIATNALISAHNVYYIAEHNPVLFAGGLGGVYSLAGGGSLIPISLIPEPATSLLLLLAGGLGAWVRRRSGQQP